nr:MAG TPA: CotH kinase protein [Caudoviricetes sp.]
MATIQEIKQQAAAVKNATQVGENTAERVGGALAGLAELAEQQDSKLSDLADKVSIKDEEGNVQDTPFRVIENEEFIMAVVDSEDRVLFGIYRATGKPYFPLNDMYHVEQNEEFFAVWLDAVDHVLLGIRRDGQIIGEIHAVGALKQVVFALQEKIDTIDSSLKEILDVFSLQENPEYLAVEQDAEGKVLSATNADGSHYIHNAKSETIPTEFSHIEDPEGRTEITTDTEGKVMSYRDSEGKMHEHDMEVTNLEVSNLNLKANSVSDIKTALIEDGFEVKTPIDWSDYSTNDGKYPLHLQEPRCALLNIITDIELQNLNKKGLSGAEQGKNYDVPCRIEFWDKQGNYFKKTAKISGQGNSSMMFPQKNIAIDMFDTETMDSAFSVKFGNWVSQDSYHLKAFYGDFIKGIGIVAYKIAMQAQKTRGVFKDVSWKSALIDERNQSSNPLHNTVSDLNMRISEARCMPDGFPVMLYRNGEFYGIYAMCLKKHRNNYHMNKSTPEHVHIDGIISNSTILGGSVDWTQFEIRNPKGLYYKELHQGKLSYDSDYPGCFEIADEETVNTWIENGKLPDGTAINAKIQKQLKITAKVHKYVTELSSAYGKVDAVSGIEEKKVEFNKYFDADNLIDYLLINMALADGDGFGPNWQWTTWDGIKWYVNQYDKDNTCGYDSKAFFVHDIRNPMSWYGANVSIMKFIQSNYSEELKLRWKELVNAQILTKENIMNEIMKWTERIGYNNYDRHYNEKWKESPCSRDPAISVNWELESIVYSSNEGNYSNTLVYNTGDKCTISQEMFLITFKCVKDGTVGVFPCKVYNSRPKYLGFYDSIWRLEKFISENLQAVNDFINKL